jgi:hypothetical protein
MAVISSVMDTINPSVEPFVRERSPETFNCLAYAIGPREFMLALPLLWRGYLPIQPRSLFQPISTLKEMLRAQFGRGLPPIDPRYVNRTAKCLSVTADDEIYTIDGEIFPLKQGTARIRLGPSISIGVADS